jgi:hypothetical protein
VQFSNFWRQHGPNCRLAGLPALAASGTQSSARQWFDLQQAYVACHCSSFQFRLTQPAALYEVQQSHGVVRGTCMSHCLDSSKYTTCDSSQYSMTTTPNTVALSPSTILFVLHPDSPVAADVRQHRVQKPCLHCSLACACKNCDGQHIQHFPLSTHCCCCCCSFAGGCVSYSCGMLLSTCCAQAS